MRFLVTGGTGFIGSHFIERALDAGHEILALRRPGSRPRIALKSEPVWIQGSLEDGLELSRTKVDALIHLAAFGVDPQFSSLEECFRWNVTASLKFWTEAAHAGIDKFIIIGSCFEYGKAGELYDRIPVTAPLIPTTPYAASKAAATMAAFGFACERKIGLVVLRPFHVYGRGEAINRFWPQLRSAALNHADFPMTDGGQVRDFLPVESAAGQILDFANGEVRSSSPQVFNLGSGVPQTLLEFARDWWKRWDAKGALLPGRVPYRVDEVMRYVPLLEHPS